VGEEGLGQCAQIATMASKTDDFVQRGARLAELIEKAAES
jgi:hypothetical protein